MKTKRGRQKEKKVFFLTRSNIERGKAVDTFLFRVPYPKGNQWVPMYVYASVIGRQLKSLLLYYLKSISAVIIIKINRWNALRLFFV